MPSGYRHTREDVVYEEDQYELTEDGRIPIPYRKTAKYQDGNTIDWLHEEGLERERNHALQSQAGVRGILLPALDSARMWFIVVVTGIGIGIAGAWLDVLVKWLSDLREGHSGELCKAWKTWGDYLGIDSILGRSLIQAFIYVVLAITFAGGAALLVVNYAPHAFHTGIPEIKAILGGYVFDAFLSPWTLFIKALGLALSVASGLSLGKEGPLVHVACCMAYVLIKLFKEFRHNEAQKRRVLAAAAAAGVSVAFGSPLGGVLFGLEELDTFANESDVMWRGFVASAIAAVSLQWVNPFGTSKLVLFQVTFVSDSWRAFELIPWVTLGGILGTLLIRLNVEIALYRRNSVLNDWPVLEVVCATSVTAAVSYLIVFARVQTSELVANLFQECDASKDYHGLCNPTATVENIFLLCLTAILKVVLTAWTFGMMIPAGIFLPTIGIGACLGRAMGLIMQSLYRAYPTAWIFLSCPPDPSVGCISPGFYAVIGASAMLGGVTRMTISLVVILFELTGALSHVLPIMICVMTSKWVGDALGKDGIYSAWIAMRRYPWLPPVDYRDKGETGASLMKPLEEIIVIEDAVTTVGELKEILARYHYHGFPIADSHGGFVGYATRQELIGALDRLQLDETEAERQKKCTFSKNRLRVPAEERADLSEALEDSVIQLRKEVPQELVVNMFQKLNLRQILFTHAGKLTGLVTKRDVVNLLTSHFPHAAALAQQPPTKSQHSYS
ncbi:H(+)/Cl(-) exchange transporter 5 [Psilocybe cubensis]|uniref:H(+)/Cl(-) exchange transporter 5 n=1 Tax=Psilocybe cubensis TaxID=181762 RepID=A0ACB8GVN7_PSICU|nr:H(+)/Cl(-) exchange transporter 5 [Psilocybe cubensis]KAH9479507.1 H(+)/Cl(-) exchange transporter 5 [Psilocybe cubensis]